MAFKASLLCILATLAVAGAEAGGLSVEPTRVELGRDQKTAAITLRNGVEGPTSIQIQAFAWTQADDGEDIYSPTKELFVSPPIVSLAPGGEQIVRTALRRQADPTTELAYRIYIQELPPRPAPGFRGVQMVLRIGLPVFVQPQTGSAKPKPAWSISRVSDTTIRVRLRNEGNAHVQVSEFALFAPPNEQPIASQVGSTYVLAGQARQWQLNVKVPLGSIGGRLRLAAQTDAGDVNVELPMEAP